MKNCYYFESEGVDEEGIPCTNFVIFEHPDDEPCPEQSEKGGKLFPGKSLKVSTGEVTHED